MPGFGHMKNMARSLALPRTGPDRAKRPPYRYGLITVLLNDPPWQPALEKPARATEMPHRSTGALTGTFTSLPDRSDSTPALPLSLGPESANAAPAGSTNPAVSTAVPIAAEIQRGFFILLLLFRLAVACATMDC